MDLAKKLMVVDPDMLHKIQHQTARPNIDNDKLSALDSAMKAILNDSKIDERSKWLLYNNALQSKLSLWKELNLPIQIPISEKQIEPEQINDKKPLLEKPLAMRGEVLRSMPRTALNRAELLYDQLAKSNQINWNEKGEVSIDNRLIPNSSIKDLIGDSVRKSQTTNPTGWSELAALMATLEVPHQIIVNQRRRDYINQLNRYGTPLEAENPNIKRRRTTEPLVLTPMRKRKHIKWDKYSFEK